MRLKQELCTILGGGRTPEQLRLLSGETVLADASTLASCGVENDAVLFLTLQKKVLHASAVVVVPFGCGGASVSGSGAACSNRSEYAWFVDTAEWTTAMRGEAGFLLAGQF